MEVFRNMRSKLLHLHWGLRLIGAVTLGLLVGLLTCRAFDKGNVNCVNCQAISGLRRDVAGLIVHAEKSLNRVQKE